MVNIKHYNFKGKKALIRVDFNVPLNDAMEVTDDTRIRAAIPSIKKVLKDGGSVVLMSHFGRPKKGPEEKYSLKHILPTVSKLLGQEVKFAPNCIDAEAVLAAGILKEGEVLMLRIRALIQRKKKAIKYMPPNWHFSETSISMMLLDRHIVPMQVLQPLQKILRRITRCLAI